MLEIAHVLLLVLPLLLTTAFARRSLEGEYLCHSSQLLSTTCGNTPTYFATLMKAPRSSRSKRCPAGRNNYKGTCVCMQDHLGPIMSTVNVRPVFWGNRWQDATYAGDKITGIMQFYHALVGSSYMNILLEYLRGAQIQLTVASTYLSDHSNAQAKFTPSTIYSYIVGNVVCGLLGPTYQNPLDADYFPVYVDFTGSGYCGFHTSMRCANSGQIIRFGLIFDQTGNGCNLGQVSGLPHTGRSNELTGMAIVSGHELAEAMTDPVRLACHERPWD
jgi:hypothetical protein